MSVTINGTGNTITPVTVNTTGSVNGITPQASNMQPFNRIINGAMTIDQRNAGASVTTGSGALVYTLDRWAALYAQTNKYTVQQNAGSVTPPAGFTNYLGVTSSSAYSVISSDFFNVLQKIEGFNTSDLAWGTASASPVTLSFWVRSSLIGEFGAAIQNSAQNRSYPFNYTISAANTWEYKTVTISGDTTGTWLTTNGTGAWVIFNLGAGANFSGTADAWSGANYTNPTGATSVVGTSGATFYITGVQLEAGSTASPFAHENYGDTLRKCKRYFQQDTTNSAYQIVGTGAYFNATYAEVWKFFEVEMRTAPTVTSNAYTNWYLLGVTEGPLPNMTLAGGYTSTKSTRIGISVTSKSAGGVFSLASNTGTGWISYSAEL